VTWRTAALAADGRVCVLVVRGVLARRAALVLRAVVMGRTALVPTGLVRLVAVRVRVCRVVVVAALAVPMRAARRRGPVRAVGGGGRARLDVAKVCAVGGVSRVVARAMARPALRLALRLGAVGERRLVGEVLRADARDVQVERVLVAVVVAVGEGRAGGERGLGAAAHHAEHRHVRQRRRLRRAVERARAGGVGAKVAERSAHYVGALAVGKEVAGADGAPLAMVREHLDQPLRVARQPRVARLRARASGRLRERRRRVAEPRRRLGRARERGEEEERED
jgi:hypothetical protein